MCVMVKSCSRFKKTVVSPLPSLPTGISLRNVHLFEGTGLLHVCTRGSQHKALKEIWLVSGLYDHRHLPVKK